MKKNDQIDAMFSVFGLSGEYRTPARIACLQRIVNKFEFETEMYVYACQLSLDKPSYSRIKYVENLLAHWKSTEIHTVQEAQMDAKKQMEQKKKSKSFRSGEWLSSGTRQFRNFTERTDNNYMEKILKQYSK